MLEETHYNTVNNFVDFHAAYRRQSNRNIVLNPAADTDLRPFYKGYVPPINRRHHMCVSLAMEIVGRIGAESPQLAQHFYIVSCEEAVEATVPYVQHCLDVGMENEVASLEKEHALIAMRITVAGREGLMIIDPGYHVARAVTVMRDQCYPHTGWFTQSEESHLKREYCYKIGGAAGVSSGGAGEFVEWSERTTRAGVETQEVSLVYVGQPYRTAVDVTVRRNLVYNFRWASGIFSLYFWFSDSNPKLSRSLLSRDAKGRVCAGIYFPVSTAGADGQLTLFYDGANEQSVKVKQKFGAFRDEKLLGVALHAHLDQLAAQLRMTGDDLTLLLRSLHDVMVDQSFVKQVLAINEEITDMSADN